MNSTDLFKWSDAESPSNSSQYFQFNATSSGTDVTNHDPSGTHFVLHPPAAMIGGLSVQTVSFILLGVGAAAPILFVSSVAVVLRLRRMRRRRQYSKYVFNHENDCRDAWHEHGGVVEPVQRKAVNGSKQIASFSDGTRRKESPFDAGGGGGTPFQKSVGRYPLSSHDLDSVIKTFFGLTSGDNTKNSSSDSTFVDAQSTLRSPDVRTQVKTKSPTTLNVRALVEVGERNGSCDTGDFSQRIPGAGKIQVYDLAPGRLGLPTGNPIGCRTSVESSYGKLNSIDSIVGSVDERTADDGDEEERKRVENWNISGSQGTSIYFDAESSPSVFRNATPNLDRDADVRCSTSSSAVHSSQRQEAAAVVPAFGLEEEHVLRCLDDVLLQYMDYSNDSDMRTDPHETNTTAHL